MHLKLFAAASVTALILFAPAAADASCCDQAKPATHEMKAGCCDHKTAAVEPSAIDILLSLNQEPNPQLEPAPPAVQATEVWFMRPVRVGRSILQGRYVIEHDNDRMARGEPCTHIYAYNDRTKPVVAFHCTHVERDRANANTVVLATVGDGSMQEMQEFQFAGEWAAHGVPASK